MVKRIGDKTLNLKQKQGYLTTHPCFNKLSAEESEALAQLTYEITLGQGDHLVVEGEMVTSLFLIVQGEAEILCRRLINEKIITVPQAILSKGESIGLNDINFFSANGQRTATVTALSKMKILALDLKDFYQFLQQHSHVQNQIQAEADKLLRLQLIKHALPFDKLTPQRVQQLSNSIQEITIPAGKILFHPGDRINKSYLIRSGEISLGSLTVKSPVTFGEATLITDTVCNITVRTIEETKLLVLSHDLLTELKTTKKNIANTFMQLMEKNCFPTKNANILTYENSTIDGQKILILKNSQNGEYFKLSQESEFVWQQINPKNTIQEIVLAVSDQFSVFDPDMIVALIAKWEKNGFINPINTGKKLQLAFAGADKWFNAGYNKIVSHFFTPLGEMILVAFIILGFLSFNYATPHIATLYKILPGSSLSLLCLIPFALASIFFHEIGRGLAAKHAGYVVNYLGIGWYGFKPVAFVDIAEIWLGTENTRVLINLAGVCSNLFMATISVFFINRTSSYFQLLFWLFAFCNYLNVIRVLNPLLELNGYQALCDWLDCQQLKKTAVTWLKQEFTQAIRSPKLFKYHMREVTFWLASIIFLLGLILVSVWLQNFLLDILNVESLPAIYKIILPTFIVLLASFNFIAEIRTRI